MRVASPDPGCWCGCSSHIFDPSMWRPQNHHICQQKKPLRAPGFLLKSTFFLEKLSLYFSLGGHFSPRNSIFFFPSGKEERSQGTKDTLRGGAQPGSVTSRGVLTHSSLLEGVQSALQKRDNGPPQPHPPQMELSLSFLLEGITLRWPLDILDHNQCGVGLF